MIYKAEDCEYTILIADLMVTLDSLDEFIIKLWIGSKDCKKESELKLIIVSIIYFTILLTVFR